jgi:pSer/pThr/pTyr-binding forkhead associated (FHA) protein
MAFIVVADKSREIDRRELTGPLSIGRAPECDLPIRDILLSRKHCMLEKIGESWVVADNASKNGTRVNGEPINRHVLHDGDVIRIGRTRIAFRGGTFVPAPKGEQRPHTRPADPIEAMASTVSGFKFNEDEEEKLDQQVMEHFPRPKPRPAEPRGFENEQVYSMLSDIASSAWDSVLVAPSRRVRTADLPRPLIDPDQVHPTHINREMLLLQAKRAEQAAAADDDQPKTRGEKMLAFVSIAGATLLTMACVWIISRGW